MSFNMEIQNVVSQLNSLNEKLNLMLQNENEEESVENNSNDESSIISSLIDESSYTMDESSIDYLSYSNDDSSTIVSSLIDESSYTTNESSIDYLSYSNDDLSCLTDDSREKKKLKKTRKRIKKLIDFEIIGEEKESYTPEEVENMSNCELLIQFKRITQKNELYCNHCYRQKKLEYWVHSIRKRCMKKDGLCSEMKIPKTCDHQQAVNSISNPINNKLYSAMRNSNSSKQYKKQLIEVKAECFEQLNKEVRLSKYNCM